MGRCVRVLRLTAIGLATGSIAILLLIWRQQLWSWLAMNFDSTRLRAFFTELGDWGPLVSIVLLTLQAVIAPLPGTLLIAANGAIYGVWCGVLISWVGVLAGAMAAYTLVTGRLFTCLRGRANASHHRLHRTRGRSAWRTPGHVAIGAHRAARHCVGLA